MATGRGRSEGLSDAQRIEMLAKVGARRPQVTEAQRAAELNAYHKKHRTEQPPAVADKSDAPSIALQTDKVLDGAVDALLRYVSRVLLSFFS